MEQMLGYCGLDCGQCPAYVATQSGDQAALEKTAAMWREEFNAPEITAESILCDGCTGGGRLSGYCSICEIRSCALGRGLETCGVDVPRDDSGDPTCRIEIDPRFALDAEELRRKLPADFRVGGDVLLH